MGFASGQEPFEQQLGPAAARTAWDMSLEAIELMDERIAAHAIACDRIKGYLYVADSARKARALEADMQSLESVYGLKTEFAVGADVQRHIQSNTYCASAYETVSGHLHPLKFGLGLARVALSLGVEFMSILQSWVSLGVQIWWPAQRRDRLMPGLASWRATARWRSMAPKWRPS